MKLFIFILLIYAPVFAKEITISSNITILNEYGGNILYIQTPEGDILIDSGLSSKSNVMASKISDVKYLVLTHRHKDHVGGASYYGKNGATIIAQKQTAQYIKEKNSGVNSLGYASIVFDNTYSLDVGQERLKLMYYPNAHTDGDIITYLPQHNIVHLGDISFGERYNYLDTNYGGKIDGLIKATQDIINLINEDTIVIPGHGELINKVQLQKNLDMYIDIKNKIQKLKNQGLSLQQIIDKKPTKKYDSKAEWALITAEKFITSIYNTLP